MNHPRLLLPALFFALFFSTALFAQPANDECNSATPIASVLNWCSSAGQFTNVGATPSGFGAASCFATVGNDVWFSFVAQATDVTVTVRGKTAQSAGGTLVNPQVALYIGNCSATINQLECQTAPNGANIVEAYQGGLFVGATYLIRIQGVGGSTGTFQICLNNYNPPVEPTSDCPTSSILCDKSPFVVQKITGAGLDTKEMDDAQCFSNGAPVNNESNSTWFTWTCSKSGPLEFTLTPLNPPDDIDFVVYRLPNGLSNCTGKIVERCMASGDFTFPSPCMGPTGLKAGSTDISENAGCGTGKDNFIAPLNMVAGESYALAINNFSNTGNGFNIEFGGAGEFQGPVPNFTTDPAAVCLGLPVQVIDASTFSIGNITEYLWSFGYDAQPQTATGKGPHTVIFNESGQHPVVLTVKTNLGCKVTEIKNVTIYPPVEVDTAIGIPECNGGTNGSVTINNIVKGTPPYQFNWQNMGFQPLNTLTGLSQGIYNVVIKDKNNCETKLDILVEELKLTVSPDVTPPLCFGDDNGVITLNVTNGTPNYLFDWGNGFQNNNTEPGFAAGIYTILGQDSKLCKGTFSVTVTDNEPMEVAMDTVHISCFGANDGSATAIPTGGVGDYKYLWSDGQTTQTATGLGRGQYSVTVTDGNECPVVGEVFVIEPAELFLDLVGVKNLKCNGVPEGEITVSASGGRRPFTFSADGTSFQADSTLKNLPAGDYFVIVQDSAGCRDSVLATIVQPTPLIVDAQPKDTTVDLGFELQFSTVTGPAFRPVEFLWTPATTLSCTDCPDPTLIAGITQTYVVQITDSTGCVAFDSVIVRVDLRRPVYAPNVITPSGKYPNDHFTLFGGPAVRQMNVLRIYDRWGELIFEKENIPMNDPNLGWDGTYKSKLMTGMFTWYADVEFVDGVVWPMSGDVTVVR